MAITTIPVACQLNLNVLNDQGAGRIVRRYQDVKPSAADADIYAVASNMAQLQERPLLSVQKTITSELFDD